MRNNEEKTYGSSNPRATNKRLRTEVEEDHIGEEAEVAEPELATSNIAAGGRSKRKRRRKTRNQASSSHSFTTSTSGTASTTTFCSSPSVVLVSGLPEGCSVLELKSRFEMYGSVSRARVDGCSGFVTYRSSDSAQAAIAAAQDPSFGIIIDSQKVHVCPVNDSRVETGMTASKLLRSEIPLSKYGRSNKKLSAVASISPGTTPKVMPFKGREIIAYDDLF